MEFSLKVQRYGQVALLSPWPEVNLGFSELQDALFIGDPKASSAQLLIDDVPLLRTGLEGRPAWHWKPRFFAGQVRADLVFDGFRPEASWLLDVSPDSKKLGREHFSQMLDDIRNHDPELLIGQEPARHRMGTLSQSDDLIIAVVRLRSYADQLLRSLSRLLVEPKRSLRPRRQLVLPRQVRRADSQTVRGAARQPILLAALGLTDVPPAHGSIHNALVDVPDVEHHFDTPANRCAAAMLQAVVIRCRQLRTALFDKVDCEISSDTVSGIKDRWPMWAKLLDHTQSACEKALRKEPFRDVRRAEITAAGLNAVSADPLYSRFYRFAWQTLRSGIHGDESEFLPLSPTWELYERWCFVEIGRRLQEIAPQFAWQFASSACLNGKSTNGRTWQLLLQPRFRCTDGNPSEDFWSVSRERYPDLVLTWKDKDSEGFLVLDAKYRTSRTAVLDAMGSAHIYRDSLRKGRNAPTFSVLLTPRGGEVQWLEDHDFITENCVGVIPLSPGGDANPIIHFLRRVLNVN